MPQVSGIWHCGLPEVGMQGWMDNREVQYIPPFIKKAAVSKALP
jgi:hypothetical protein